MPLFLGLNQLELLEKTVQIFYAAKLYCTPAVWLTENFRTYDEVNPVWPGELLLMAEFSGVFIFAIMAFSWIARASAKGKAAGLWRVRLVLDAATCVVWGWCMFVTWDNQFLFESQGQLGFLPVSPLHANMLCEAFFTLAFFFSFVMNVDTVDEDDPWHDTTNNIPNHRENALKAILAKKKHMAQPDDTILRHVLKHGLYKKTN